MKLNNVAALRVLRQDIEQAIKPICEKHGIAIKIGTMRFTPDGLNCGSKLEISAVNEATGIAETREHCDFRQYAQMYDLKPDMLDQTFTYGHETYQIVGLKVRSQKNPVLAKKLPDGPTYKFSADVVKVMLAASAKKSEKPAANAKSDSATLQA